VHGQQWAKHSKEKIEAVLKHIDCRESVTLYDRDWSSQKAWAVRRDEFALDPNLTAAFRTGYGEAAIALRFSTTVLRSSVAMIR
jgi:hypothetical protein